MTSSQRQIIVHPVKVHHSRPSAPPPLRPSALRPSAPPPLRPSAPPPLRPSAPLPAVSHPLSSQVIINHFTSTSLCPHLDSIIPPPSPNKLFCCNLASVRNMEENQKIMELTPAATKLWIGLFRETWKWTDGSNSSFRNWKAGEPNNYQNQNENCAVADFESSGQWDDRNCDEKRAFVCYTKVTLRRY
uniref:C-type lectin domain-containing protein n=1 Tax=Oryzias latipes TaxID=8090 RepID=A0A3P9IGU2_ORYLA